MPEITVRDALPEDIADITRLEELAFPLPWSEESIRYDIEKNEKAIVLVAERDGVFAGYADIWCVLDEGMLNNIAVMPEQRGKHIGNAIMETLIGRIRAEGMIEMSLEVRVSNGVAIGLYEKLGFESAGTRKKYYTDNGEDALIMRRNI